MFNQDSSWYSSDQLVPLDIALEPRWVRRDELLRELAIAKLQTPLSDTLYAYRASRTHYEPYQFRPALKFLSNPQQRLLIADEVGLGKTIEAAIIYLELKARLEIERVLILCPSRLTQKWQSELRNRFDEQFSILNTQLTRQLLEDFKRFGNGLTFKAITSFENVRRTQFLEELLIQRIPLDLLIVDEAHYLRNEATKTFQVGQTLVDTADAAIFLTATPIHLKTRDLFNLLNLLAPEDFDDPSIFEDLVAPNEAIHRAASRLSAGNPKGALQALVEVERCSLRERFLANPVYTAVKQQLRDLIEHQSQDRATKVSLQRDIYDLNTLSTIMTRARKREFIDKSPVRTAYSIVVEFNDAERALYDGVVWETRLGLQKTGSTALGFSTVMRERQAASCLPAFCEKVAAESRNQTFTLDDVDVSQFDPFVEIEDDANNQRAIRSRNGALLSMARQLSGIDSKFDKLNELLSRILKEETSIKILVFSFFKTTLRYLERRLKAEGFSVATIHGEIPMIERTRIIEHFRSDHGPSIMLSSEVGAEGLDFQFCGVLVNYDLPWNPMQVEQRIGRLDRFGQRHERIRIYNFYIDDTIESRIFQRLYDRIEIFKKSIGDIEDILGDEIRRLSIRILRAELTPEEEAALVDEAAERVIRREREESELDKHRDALLGQGAILDQQVERARQSGHYVSGDEIRSILHTHLSLEFPLTRLQYDDEEPCLTIEFEPNLRVELGRFIERNKLRSVISDNLAAVLAGNRNRLAVTFDADLARERPALEFVTARHPLVGLALDHWRAKQMPGLPASEVEVDGPAEEAGDGTFFIYLIQIGGIRQRVVIEPVIIMDDRHAVRDTESRLLAAIQEGARFPAEISRNDDDFEQAEEEAAEIIALRKAALLHDVSRQNDALIAARLASTRASFEAKIDRTHTALSHTMDERIQRMRRAQIENLRAKLQEKIAEINSAKEITISSQVIAGGRIRIVPH